MLSIRMSETRDLARAWQAVLGRLELEINTHNYNTWLRGTRPLRFEDGTLTVEARTSFNCDWLNQRLNLVVHRAVETVMGEPIAVYFVPRGSEGGADSSEGPILPAPKAPPPLIGSVNCAYTFERYVASEGNQLALQSCRRLLGDAEFTISPVVVIGRPGMGKTHLLHALACAARDARQVVACMGAEEFTSRYLGAIRRGDVEEFQRGVRSAQLLVIDDLQYLAGKKGTQDELVHTIDAICNAGGKVAVGSECHPADLDLHERLSSRLTAGIVARVEPFRMGERREFIERITATSRAALPPWAIERIAAVEAASVRDLQGAVHAAVMLANCDRLDLGRLDAELVRVAIAAAQPGADAGKDTLARVAAYFEVAVEELAGRSRKAQVTKARSVAIAALKEQGRSLAEIGELLGGRDRTTISPLVERGREMLKQDADLKRRLAAS